MPISASDTSSQPSVPAFTPDFTPSSTPTPRLGLEHKLVISPTSGQSFKTMDEAKTDKTQEGEKSAMQQNDSTEKKQTSGNKKSKKKCCRKHICKKHRKSKKSKKEESNDSDSSDSSSDSDSSNSSDSSSGSSASSSSSSSSSESEAEKSKSKSKKGKKKLSKKAAKKSKRRSKPDSSSEESSDDEAESSNDEEEESAKSGKKSKKSKKSEKSEKPTQEEETKEEATEQQAPDQSKEILAALQKLLAQREEEDESSTKSKKSKKSKKGSASYKRLDQIWDRENYDWTLRPSADADKQEDLSEHTFVIRRCFDWENKYTETVVDIKSKVLRNILRIVLKKCRGISLAEDEPAIDPNTLFLYRNDFAEHRKQLKDKLNIERKKKVKKLLKIQIAQLKLLIKYIDKDYAKISRTLYPMLEKGDITFDLLWCLFRTDDICYTSTYGTGDEPRAFKITTINKENSIVRGTWYEIDGEYLEFNGKEFGLGDVSVDCDSFKGPRKITSLPCYPLKYHKDPEGMKEKLITRGKKFVSLAGLHYKYHKGLAFVKRRRQIVKVNVNSRIMIAPGDFREINPNYPISTIRASSEGNLLDAENNGSGDEGDCSCAGGDQEDSNGDADGGSTDDGPKYKNKLVKDNKGRYQVVEVEVDDEGKEVQKERLENIEKGFEIQREFSDEELLIASPVLLGFAFSEKAWLEFTVDGVHEIEFNEFAFDSLVLPEAQKDLVKALVESHSSENKDRSNIDDVIQGKGRGLVVVLHGQPGVGKTLTAESIAELLQRPLYMVSAGELGTSPRELETFLQQILDLAHRWQAVLLLDEADVFLEARSPQDVHRNALVSIFLRLLEYFQGILFLTTNRVATFDEAFHSRIHLGIRYPELDFKARRSIFAMFLNKVAELPINRETIDVVVPEDDTKSKASRAVSGNGTKKSPTTVKVIKCVHPNFSSEDLDRLARAHLNGRQVKNIIRSAQALAVNEGSDLKLNHILQVMSVAESFANDIRGGSGASDMLNGGYL